MRVVAAHLLCGRSSHHGRGSTTGGKGLVGIVLPGVVLDSRVRVWNLAAHIATAILFSGS